MTPGIVADVANDEHHGGAAAKHERPSAQPAENVAHPMDPQVDAGQPDQRR